MLSTIKDFFRPHTFLKTPRIWVICQPGADSSRRRGRRWPDRWVGPNPAAVEEREQQRVTRREVRGCAEGRWKRGLSFPARGRKAAGSAPAGSPGTTVATRPACHSGRTQAAHFPASEGFFFFFFFPSGLFLCSFPGSWSVYFGKLRMEAWSARFAVSALPRASQGFLP